MVRLGKNHGGYHGEQIDIRSLLRGVETTALHHGWSLDVYHETPEFKFLALRRAPLSTLNSRPSTHLYISTGIHGDEPAGPLAALRLLQENKWPASLEVWLLPCLNPTGFPLNRRENDKGIDLNRQYLHPASDETRAHIAWLQRQPDFGVTLCLHEDWESHGFYLYELNLDNHPSLAKPIVAAVSKVCPIDPSEVIEGRAAENGIIRPSADPRSRPDWPEAFWLITNKTRLSYTLEAPSDFALEVRVNALVAGVNAALQKLA